MLFIGLMLIALAMFFVYLDQGLAAGLCFIAAVAMLAARLLSKTGHAAKSVGEGLAKGVREDVSKAETGHPDFSVAKEGIENAVDLAGQQMYAGYNRKKPYIGDQHQFKFKGLGAFGEAAQKIIDTFGKVFK